MCSYNDTTDSLTHFQIEIALSHHVGFWKDIGKTIKVEILFECPFSLFHAVKCVGLDSTQDKEHLFVF